MSLPSGKSEIPVFISPTDLRASLGTTTENPRIAECAMAANSQVTMALKAHAENTPIKEGTPTYQEAVRVAVLYAQYMWYLRVQQPEMANEYHRNYTNAMKELKMALRVEPTPRQEPFHMTVSDFQSERKVPYSQIGFAGDTENLY